MDKTIPKSNHIMSLLKCLLCSYIVTGLALLLLALLVYKFDFDDAKVKVGVIIIYIVSCFLGGFILGKLKRSNKFLWGAACGATYFTILMLVSFVVNHGIGNSGVGVFTILTMCVASGMIGGMVS